MTINHIDYDELYTQYSSLYLVELLIFESKETITNTFLVGLIDNG